MAKRKSKKKAEAKKPKKKLKVKMPKVSFGLWQITTIIMLFVFGFSIFGGFSGLTGLFVLPPVTEDETGVTLTILTDDSCQFCDYSQGLAFFQQYVTDMNVKEIPYDSAEGSSLVRTLGVQVVPTFLFSEAITSEEIYSQIAPYFAQVGDYYAIYPIWIQRMIDLDAPDVNIDLVMGDETISQAEGVIAVALYSSIPNVVLNELAPTSSEAQSLISAYGIQAPAFIVPENLIEQELKDNIDSGLLSLQGAVDGCNKVASDAEFMTVQSKDIIHLSETTVPAYPQSDTPTLEFYVMSFCPYGNLAEDILEPVFDLLGDKADIVPHYIVGGSPGGWTSLHGETELNQDVRELCVWNYYDHQTWWDFVSDINEQCTNSNVDTCWSGVAQGVGIDVDQIDTCLANEIDTILMAETLLTTSYSITGSPTILINGEKYLGQRTPDDLKTALCCAFNTAPEECETILSDQTQGAEGSC
jgi:hypothetical protein